MKSFFTEYSRKIWMRILVFAMMGMGWDVLMTTAQQIIGGQIDKDAIQTASTWMFLVYGSIPLVVLPMDKLLMKLRVPKFIGLALFLVLFYMAEYSWGTFFHSVGIEPWNYNWYTPERFNSSSGYVSFHPVIILSWIVFIVIGRALDRRLRLKSE